MATRNNRPSIEDTSIDVELDTKQTTAKLDLDISHLALDIGGSLIKLVYFSRDENEPVDDNRKNNVYYPVLGGRLNFVMFETCKINECLDFIYSKQLHRRGMDSSQLSETPTTGNTVIKVTGGGAYKFADLFKERLGISIEKEDEMDCLVAGANFLLKTVRDEALTHMKGQKEFVQIDSNDLFPYLLVNIGSGVSIIKVDGDGVFERIGGTSIGGGTFCGLGRLLTSFDELLELSKHGDCKKVDMLVGDIYGRNYDKHGLAASITASCFGKIVTENLELEDCRREDLALALLQMISYDIVQTSYDKALPFGLKRMFFGGFFIRDHAFTMDTISSAVQFWSKGQAQAMFLRHEGFLGALGAFMSYEKHGLDDLMVHHLAERLPTATGAPYIGGNIHGSPLGDEKVMEENSREDVEENYEGFMSGDTEQPMDDIPPSSQQNSSKSSKNEKSCKTRSPISQSLHQCSPKKSGKKKSRRFLMRIRGWITSVFRVDKI